MYVYVHVHVYIYVYAYVYVHMHMYIYMYMYMYVYMYKYAPHNDVSVNDGPHIRRWFDKSIIIPLCYNFLQYSVQ